MYAVAFDLVVADTARHHPKGVSQAYLDIGATLEGFGFTRQQGSVYLSEHEDLAKLFGAMQALRAMGWFPHAVRDVRAFRVEQWSDFTPTMKATPQG